MRYFQKIEVDSIETDQPQIANEQKHIKTQYTFSKYNQINQN